MRRIEVVELTLIAAATVAAAWLAPRLPARLPIGMLALVAAAVQLTQGLLRDAWLLWRSRQAARTPSATGQRCLCVESGLGVIAIVLGVALLLSGAGGTVTLQRMGWAVVVVTSLATGFALKDWVFEWNPWRLRREKDHANIIFSWRKK